MFIIYLFCTARNTSYEVQRSSWGHKSENIISGVYEHYDPDQPSAIVNYMGLVDYGLLKNVNSVTVRPMQGTPQTMAPEQWQGQYYYQSDIYSSAEVVGVMLGGASSCESYE